MPDENIIRHLSSIGCSQCSDQRKRPSEGGQAGRLWMERRMTDDTCHPPSAIRQLLGDVHGFGLGDVHGGCLAMFTALGTWCCAEQPWHHPFLTG